MKTKLLAAAVCALALSACDFEKRPDSAPDQGGGAGVTQPGRSGAAPMTPPGGGANRSAPPAGGGSSSGGSSSAQ